VSQNGKSRRFGSCHLESQNYFGQNNAQARGSFAVALGVREAVR
jgi:hypothetical protein